MPWWFPLALIAGLLALFVALRLVVNRTGGRAPGWRLRCTRCGRTRDAGEAGVVRVAAASTVNRTIGWCGACRRLRIVAVERTPRG